MNIPPRYDPASIEDKIYKAWEEKNFFHGDEKSDKKSYSIVIPPPNITGILHMGHALNNTIQDILIRWKRMNGFEAMWLPGTDHAGIATQNVVEKEIAKQGLKRDDLGREKFVEKVCEWKEKYGGTIIKQLKRLGSSCDWERTRFTMDEGLSIAVMEVFIKLYEEGLIYKGDYIINWCPRCGTALSDEEAEHSDIKGMLYYIKYPFKDALKLEIENEDYLVIATTRPETMLGDVAVAVNPKDNRYRGLTQRKLILPILKRELEIISDDTVDPSFGTGALKVTPAHDPVDFELGVKHNLKSINVMNPDASINSNGADYEGMDRFEARETIIDDLKQRKLFIKSEEHLHAVKHCYRCHTVVEPRLSKQWFVKMKPLAHDAIKKVKSGEIKFYPERWTKVYLNWMENIKDWCISRQIWWGHRIPVWYCMDCHKGKNIRDIDVTKNDRKGVVVHSLSFPRKRESFKCQTCGGANLEQDPDVLDTWFSSWLWPISTLGWPDKTKDLAKFYPTDSLVTAQEIIFFWVSRMIMAGLKFTGKVPFKDVYIHGTVRDATGTKMSKSLGNVIDPIDIINDVGSDALRFSIISITSQGQDVFLSKEKFELGRNFANKLWNAARFVLIEIEKSYVPEDGETIKKEIADKWILTAFNETVKKVDKSLEMYRFNEATGEIYDFVWHKYCDWYLEFSKLSDNKKTTSTILINVLSGLLKLLHPFMPFITEEIWQKLPQKSSEWLIRADWPKYDKKSIYTKEYEGMEKIIDVITSLRNIRSFWNIDPKTVLSCDLLTSIKSDITLVDETRIYIEKLAKCNIRGIGSNIKRQAGSISILVKDIRIFVPLEGAVDIDKETQRIKEKISEIEKYLVSINNKLKNKDFVGKAPKDIVAKERDKKDTFARQVSTLKENLKAIE